jgi:hypothetical protein
VMLPAHVHSNAPSDKPCQVWRNSVRDQPKSARGPPAASVGFAAEHQCPGSIQKPSKSVAHPTVPANAPRQPRYAAHTCCYCSSFWHPFQQDTLTSTSHRCLEESFTVGGVRWAVASTSGATRSAWCTPPSPGHSCPEEGSRAQCKAFCNIYMTASKAPATYRCGSPASRSCQPLPKSSWLAFRT